MVRRVLCRAIVVAPGTQGAYIVDSLSLAGPRKGLLLHQAGWEVVLAAVVRECVTSGFASRCTESATCGVQGADSRGG